MAGAMDDVMDWILNGTALLVALAIIAIGTGYIATPTTMTHSFGLPLPGGGRTYRWLGSMPTSRNRMSLISTMELQHSG